MKWSNPRTLLALAVILGIGGFVVGGIIAAVQGRSAGAEEIAAVGVLMGTIVGAVALDSRRKTDDE
jgi:outer membrane lipoprotein SlyB